MKSINVTRSKMPDFEEYVEEIRELWDSHWLTNMGVKHQKLESELTKYLSTPNVALFSNGHLALETVISALQLSGEVITTPFTFASTTHAIVRNGLEPVFCDISSSDFTMNIEKLESLITERTSAIIPVHVYGNVCNVYAIEAIAKKYNLKVVYDAAHAFGVTIDGVGIGNFGDASMFSFHATKVFNTIEGGAITSKDLNLKLTLDNLKNFGITGSESIENVGTNAKMNEFQAAMGLCNLRYIEKEILMRKVIVESYRELLGDLPGIQLASIQNNVKSNYSYFPVIFDGYKRSRDEVLEALNGEQIFARKYFYPLTNSLGCFKGKYNTDDTPIAKFLSERVLTLPLYSDLDLADVEKICKIIKG